MSARLARYQLDRAIRQAESAIQDALSALDSVAEAEMVLLALRFPERRLELHSGMGSTFLQISKRKPSYGFDEYTWGPDAGRDSHHHWPDGVAKPMPGLWEAMHHFTDTIGHGIDPGFGTIIYDKGERIEGLA